MITKLFLYNEPELKPTFRLLQALDANYSYKKDLISRLQPYIEGAVALFREYNDDSQDQLQLFATIETRADVFNLNFHACSSWTFDEIQRRVSLLPSILPEGCEPTTPGVFCFVNEGYRPRITFDHEIRLTEHWRVLARFSLHVGGNPCFTHHTIPSEPTSLTIVDLKESK
jgi:hypothetical protein